MYNDKVHGNYQIAGFCDFFFVCLFGVCVLRFFPPLLFGGNSRCGENSKMKNKKLSVCKPQLDA